MKKAKSIDERIRRLEFKLKWYQTSVNILIGHIDLLKLERDKAQKKEKSHHGINKFGEQY